jgi:hypothetical protein
VAENPADLVKYLEQLRSRLEQGFSRETAAPGFPSPSVSSGQCAAVSLIGRELLGGDFVSAVIDGHSHWFNRILDGNILLDIDLTGDQFGRPRIQIASPDNLYPSSKVRDPGEVHKETIARAVRLAQKADLPEVEVRLRGWLNERNQ